MHVSEGILTSTGGMTTHAAVVARGMGTPCVAGAGEFRSTRKARTINVGGKTLRPEGLVSLDGSTGEVMDGAGRHVEAELSGPFATIMKWADKYRTLKVRTNADTPDDAEAGPRASAPKASACAAPSTCSSTRERIQHMREMILATTIEERNAALREACCRISAKDFIGIFKAMNGLPVTIRLLDPPLHEFLPHDEKDRRPSWPRSLGMTLRAGEAPRAAAARDEPDARPSRLPPGGHLSRNSRDAGARRSSKRRSPARRRRSRSCPRS